MANENQNETGKKVGRVQPVFLAIAAVIILLFGLASGFDIFLKLDYRLYDGLLHLKKAPPQNEKVALVTIDDESLADPEMGEWPWPRNIIADTLIRMKELGAEWAVFDIEYLSPSTAGVNSKIKKEINSSFAESENVIVGSYEQISGDVLNGMSMDDFAYFSDMYVNDILYPSLDNLKYHISDNIYQDNDLYFQRALQFFGNAWLTFNHNDLAFTYEPEYIDFVKSFQLKFDVTDLGDYVKKSNEYTLTHIYDSLGRGFSPTLQKIGIGAFGIGFTNSIVDDDGVRRRYELLFEDEGSYGGQLVFAPLMNSLGVTKLTRTRNSLICHDALFPGETTRQNLKIPLDKNGRILINFIHEKMRNSFKQIPVLNIKRLDWSEERIVSNIEALSNYGYFDYENEVDTVMKAGTEQLMAIYQEIESTKESMLERCTGYTKNGAGADGLADEDYDYLYSMRKAYFDYIKDFLEAHPENRIIEILDTIYRDRYGDEIIDNNIADIKTYMENLREEYIYYVNLENVLREKLEGTYCIVGNTASSTSDIGAQPFEQQYQNVGLHANLMNTILNRQFFTYADWYWGFIVAVLLSFVPYIFNSKKKRVRNISGAVLLVGFTAAIIALFVFGNIYIPMIGSILYFIAFYLFGVVFRFVKSEHEKKFITNAFSQCLAPDVVKELINNPSSFRLGGDSLEMTAIFTDIQKFSAFSELLNAAQLVALLNYYLTKMSDIIIDEKGTVDKYEGDAIIALVGAPKRLEDHSFRACSAAIKMKQSEAVMNAEILEIVKKDKPEEMEQDLYDALKIMVANGKTIFTRIGINSGEMVAGYMGSEKKKNYTMMGNNVNLASRLEGVNKVYASSILCSGQTYEWANVGENKDKILFRRLDRVRVVNITTPVQLYNVIGFADQVSAQQKMELDIFHTALDKYLAKDFVNAGKLFLEANKTFADETALIFAERCKTNIENGVSEGWDGIVNLTSK
ncbi:MAG: CHASE2 domain-containing protein [Treponema sp.]|nr:CHASE2 domain-containing protein [Treponema sp.]